MSTEEPTKRQKTDEMKRVLVFGGKTGWIGQIMVGLTKKEGANANRSALELMIHSLLS
jgi:hypothetical protein